MRLRRTGAQLNASRATIRAIGALGVMAALLGGAAGCDTGAPVNGVSASDPYVEVRPLTQLQPGRATHVAVNSVGNLYWVQESTDGDDGVIAMGVEGVPRATPLTTAAILNALDAPSEGTGNIQSIAAGGDSELYFYFSGGVKRQTYAALGRFDPRSGEIRILADTAALALESRMGLSLSLARGRVIPSGRSVYFWLRHSDGSALFAFDPRQLPLAGPLPLRRVLEAITFDAAPVELRRETAMLSSDLSGGLLLTDDSSGAIYRVDVAAATATRAASLVGVPTRHSAPVGVPDPKNGMVLFGAMVAVREANTLADLEAPKLRVDFPALAVLTLQDATAFGREKIHAPSGFPVYAMDLPDLVPDRSPDTWLAHDNASGQLLRLKLKR